MINLKVNSYYRDGDSEGFYNIIKITHEYDEWYYFKVLEHNTQWCYERSCRIHKSTVYTRLQELKGYNTPLYKVINS